MDCIFCKIISKEIPANVILEDEDLIVFHDISPKAPVHVLILPKKHLSTLSDASATDINLLGKLVFAVKEIAIKFNISEGYKVVINNGEKSGQVVFHLHLHVLGGWADNPKWKI